MPTSRQIARSYRMPISATLDTVPSLQGLQVAADRPEVKNFSVLTRDYTGINTKVPHTFANGTGRYLLLTYDNWGVGWDPAVNGTSPVGSPFDNPNLNNVTFECALSELDGSAFYPGEFVRLYAADGTVTELPDTPSSVVVPGGGFAVARVDLGASRAPGTQLMEHCYVSCTSNAWLWRHQANLSGLDGETVSASVGEPSKVTQMWSGTKPSIAGPSRDGAGVWASSIRHLDAPPAQLVHPCIVNGDSLSAGAYGWRKYLKDNRVPHVHLGRSTEAAFTFLLNDPKSAYRRRLGALGGFTRGIIQYLTNDLVLNNPTQTAALFQTKIGQLVTMQEGWGADAVMVGTLPANTKSTDGFTTLANQTLVTGGTNTRGKNQQVLQDYNAWLRAGAPYGTVSPQAYDNPTLGAYVADVGRAVSVLDSSPGDTPSTIEKWRTTGGARTLDGLHPGTSLGVSDWAAAIPVQFIQASTGG